jgi:hypothetical protein
MVNGWAVQIKLSNQRRTSMKKILPVVMLLSVMAISVMFMPSGESQKVHAASATISATATAVDACGDRCGQAGEEAYSSCMTTMGNGEICLIVEVNVICGCLARSNCHVQCVEGEQQIESLRNKHAVAKLIRNDRHLRFVDE